MRKLVERYINIQKHQIPKIYRKDTVRTAHEIKYLSSRNTQRCFIEIANEGSG